ncbi:MAG TPA: O-methyltransferase [Candidatus Nanoarchaeia archaeon]|nr:O-methyltransferase [Candidatus Nanoarchaeia archaeon]
MNPDLILNDIESLSRKNFLPIIGPVKGKFLATAIKKYKVKKILEVGTLVGYSSILMAKHLPKEGKIFTIEINRKSAKIAEDNIKKAGLSEKIRVIVGDAKKIIPKLKEKFDMLFIDAVKEDYLEYLKLAENKLNKGCIVLADNAKIFANEMNDYLEYVRNSGRYKSSLLDAGFDGVEFSIRLD